MRYEHLSDDALIAFGRGRVGHERLTVAEIVAVIVEVEGRRLHLAHAFSSIYDFCLRGLGLTESEAQRRIAAARVVRRFPIAFEALATGAVHLSNLVLLKDVLDEANVADVLARATGKTKLEVGMIVAGLAPKPDVPPSISPLPQDAQRTLSGGATTSAASCAPPLTPLSPGRYKVELTGDEALRAKIERAQDLTREENPSGDLATMFAAALDVFIAHREKKMRAKTSRPRAAKASKDPGYVTAAARREVFDRDGEQCTFLGPKGERCPARAKLEIDHKRARALGGEGTPENLRVLCEPHNLYEAERTFGRELVAKKIAARRASAKCAPQVRASAKSGPQVRSEANGSQQVRSEANGSQQVPAAATHDPQLHASTPDEDGVARDRSEGVDHSREPRAMVKAALVGLGFRARAVDTTLDAFACATWERPLQELVRDAIGKLAP